MKLLLKLMIMGSRVGCVLSIAGVNALLATDNPKPAPAQPAASKPKPEESIVKPSPPNSKAPIEDKEVTDYLAKRGFIIVDPAAPAKAAGANKDASGDLEGFAVKFKSHRQAAYEAERHSAEKIKAHVQAADDLARLLLSGGAPSPVLR
jgi:hypothetical protein